MIERIDIFFLFCLEEFEFPLLLLAKKLQYSFLEVHFDKNLSETAGHIEIIIFLVKSLSAVIYFSHLTTFFYIFTGFDDDGTPHLYQTDPAGVYTEWKANAIGRNAKTVREFLEKNFPSNDVQNVTEHDTIKLAVKALLEVVQLGGKCYVLTLF